MKAIIIDDESDARDALHLTLNRYCPDIRVIASVEKPSEALMLIKKHKPDLIFLDVQMPLMNGFEMLRQLDESDINVIFVTAHDKYAIKAIRFSALDYLLKPVDAEELQQAVKRASEKQNRPEHKMKLKSFLDNTYSKQEHLGHLSIPTTEGLLFLDINEIIYCKADDNYTEIMRVKHPKVIVSKTLKNIEEMLEGYSFFRIHQTWLINLKFMQRYVKGDGGHVIMKDGTSLEVARRKKEEFLLRISKP
ncbi:MAG: LytTR family DNA-binding domain-containing protein [Saprospiraceae bacterium]